MKVDAVSPVKVINDNTAAARKLADNPVEKTSNQDDQPSQLNNWIVKAPNQDDSSSQFNNVVVKTAKSDDQPSQITNAVTKTLNQEDLQTRLKNQQKEKVEKALKIINMAYKEVNIESSYSIDERTNTEVVKIVNSITGEVIKQYPPQDMLNMIHKMYDMYGILMDEKV